MQITSHYFCAALIFEDGIVVRAAPILKWMIGWTEDEVRKYARKKRWYVD